MDNKDSFYNYLQVAQTIIANMSMLYLLDSTASKPNMHNDTESLIEILHDEYDFNLEFTCLSADELSDIGFIYLDNNCKFMLIPIWFIPFFPEGYPLYLTNGEPYNSTLEGDTVKIINNQWIDLTVKID